MDITPKVDAQEYLDWIEAEVRRRPHLYSDDELVDMLHDTREQISRADPTHELLGRIDFLCREMTAAPAA
ncbi:hypothetical protein U8C31_13920 [Sinorhizobium medicae]|uniref:hypothetical protein n=1 Tax=Sinorhizobium medicae TaxID=110321 RepID=UPI002AF6B37A|nr:hypothetical protein [Sinorhizobium medicae]WQO71391.1 hypothetical protein U8C31_13920 [Sinorhizobium medicae]